ncbi:MAG: hypothetical protein CVV44_12600 [Spirochaetae bacterium HGW-Spirochaetae-1]|jgi:hypothetical protein|nr:MAG: hypothetical protein CVV44_12600 [Spirochaetae bacterium HGW-Spirochaetae-1]
MDIKVKIIYLDWNVINHLHDGILPIELKNLLISLQEERKIICPYTAEHLSELYRDSDSIQDSEHRILALIKTLSEITKNILWYFDYRDNNYYFKKIHPYQYYLNQKEEKEEYGFSIRFLYRLIFYFMKFQTIKFTRIISKQSRIKFKDIHIKTIYDPNNPIGSLMLITRNLTEINTRAFELQRNKLNLCPKELNSLVGDELIKKINDEIGKWTKTHDFNSIVDSSLQYQKGGQFYKEAGLNTFLEMMGYHKDKKSITIESKLSDSNHLIFGLKAHTFITHDKRLFNRALQIANMEDLTTKVIWAKDAINYLESI